MTTRRPVRTQWVEKEKAPPAPPPTSAQQKARRLPRPGPGIVVTVPLSLLPEYLQLYGLTPMTRGEVRDNETATGQRKPSGMLYIRRTAPVKRTPEEGK